MSQRTCTVDNCGRPHAARGMCSSHYGSWHRRLNGRKDLIYVHACEICGAGWSSRQKHARFCSDACKGQHYSATMRRRCALPDEHPVRLLIAAEKERQRVVRAATKLSAFEWRTPRECPGCACLFTPLYTPTAITCSKRCSRRVHRWRRKAAERGAPGSFTWSEFMRLARKFDYGCAYCGDKPGQLDPDHVIPLSRGGSNSTTNLLPSCRPCNTDKSANLLDEWAESRARRGLPPRATEWSPDDRRYWHLTDVTLALSA